MAVWEDDAAVAMMSSGFLAIPSILLKSYKKMGLSDEEMMMLLQILQFQQERGMAPNPSELAERMSLDEQGVVAIMRSLLHTGFLDMGEDAFDLRPLYRKLSEQLQPPKPKPNAFASLELLEKKEQKSMSVFALFEQEFGRPLSPLENEMIIRWLDEDQYKEEIIREALREAVLSAKFNFKYIDRILFEWQKNHIRTLQDLNAYREQFRNRMPSSRGGQSKGARKEAPAVAAAPEQENKYDAFYKLYGRE